MALGPVQQDGDMKSPRLQGDDFVLPKTVGVLINHALEARYVRAIESVDPQVRALLVYTPDEWLPKGQASALKDQWPKAEGAELDMLLVEAEVLFSFSFPVEWVDKMPKLKWVQLASAGSDHVLRAGLLDRRPELLLSTASGVHEISISEHILGMILHFSRSFNKAVHNQSLHKWERFAAGEAYGQMVCFIGYGAIAKRAASLCKALGMRSVAVRASLVEQQPGIEAVERFYPLADLNETLAQADYVVVAAPRTPTSERMIGREQLAAMKPSAVLVNISRGALVDEAALVEALREGRLGGAGMDVFEQEPLPESSPLWNMTNVLITPHVSGSTPNYNERVTALFCANLARYLRGEAVRNLVDKERGY
jgi:phosphoglycerate dehydrogenase-like enzyme